MDFELQIRTFLKRLIQQFLGFFSAKIVTKSDHTMNGLQPFVREFFIQQCSGVLHIGAHEGQERDFYFQLSKPVIWVEALRDHFEQLQNNIQEYPNQKAFNVLLDSSCLISRNFYITSNNGESSSIYPLANNEYWNNLKNTDMYTLPSQRLDCFFDKSQIVGHNYWIIDVQGAEIEVLRGSGDLLNYCKYLQIEISQEEFYIGGAQFEDLRKFLELKMFIPLWLPRKFHEEVIFLNAKFENHHGFYM